MRKLFCAGIAGSWLGQGENDDRRSDIENLEWADWFEQMFAEMDTLEWKLRFEQRNQFEREVLYAGLTELNTGFDSPLVGHFSPVDFFTVIDHCESLSVRVIGIEVFTTDVEAPSKIADGGHRNLSRRGIPLGAPIGPEVH
jgi:hypothetical protein